MLCKWCKWLLVEPQKYAGQIGEHDFGDGNQKLLATRVVGLWCFRHQHAVVGAAGTERGIMWHSSVDVAAQLPMSRTSLTVTVGYSTINLSRRVRLAEQNEGPKKIRLPGTSHLSACQ